MKKNNLPESVVNFLNYSKTIKGLSKSTVEAYRIDLGIFVEFAQKYKKRKVIDIDIIRTFTLNDLHMFVIYLENERKNDVLARARKVSALKSYFEYLQNITKEIIDNPAYSLEKPKLPKRNPKYLTLEESQQLLKSMDKQSKNYERNYCIITLFLQTGMRLSELASIKVDDIKNDTLTIIGKGNKERTIYLNDASLRAISQYMNVRNQYELDDDRLFPIKERMIELVVKNNIIGAGIKNGKEFSPHKLRHTSATLMYKYGKSDIRSIQIILGHANINTTEIYTHVDDDMCRDAVNSNPLNF
jgi:site-specific recombinase XerD